MKIEILEGRRLLLRPLDEADAAALAEAVDASRAMLKRRLRWAAEPQSVDDEKRFVAAAAGKVQKGEALVWGLFDARARRLVGVSSLDEICPEGARARFGIWVRSDRQDRGCAWEAGRLIAEHAFRKAGFHRLYARIDPTNRAFRKVLKKMGFRYEGCLRGDKRLNGRWIDQECWGLLRQEWKK
jgi:RimJ/RimL family protein N-acetyltransferase